MLQIEPLPERYTKSSQSTCTLPSRTSPNGSARNRLRLSSGNHSMTASEYAPGRTREPAGTGRTPMFHCECRKSRFQAKPRRRRIADNDPFSRSTLTFFRRVGGLSLIEQLSLKSLYLRILADG